MTSLFLVNLSNILVMRRRLLLFSFILTILIGFSAAEVYITESGISVSGNYSSPFIDGINYGGIADGGLEVNSQSVNDVISLSNGSSVTIVDNFEPDTNASTSCTAGQVLTGSGCVERYSASDDGDTSSTNERQGIDEVLSQDSTATNQLDMSSGTLVVPTGDIY